MAANQYRPAPADRVYMAANGHEMVLAPTFSKRTGWGFHSSAGAYHSGTCPCIGAEDGGYNVAEYAGESE